MKTDQRSRCVVVVGQIARDLALRVHEVPEPGRSAPVAERRELLGGKGANQAIGLARLGLHPILISAVGEDNHGARLVEQAIGDGIDMAAVAYRPVSPSALIVSLVDGEGWRYLEHIPADMLVSESDIERATPAFARAGTVTIQLQQPPESALAAAELGRECGCRVVLDGAPPDEYRERLLARADVIRADAHEAELLTGCRIRRAADAVAAGQEILRRGPALVALAAGADGNVLVWPGGSEVIPLDGGPVVDTTGAGDAFVAGLVAGLADGLGPGESGRRGAAAAAHTVRHLGGRPRFDSVEGLGSS